MAGENAKTLISLVLKINMCKSRISRVAVTNEEVVRMARRLGCKEENIPFRYLGLPVCGNMNRVANKQPLIDKFRSKLLGWKARPSLWGDGYAYVTPCWEV